MRIDNVELSRDAGRCEIAVFGPGEVPAVNILVLLFMALFPAMGVFVLLFDPRLQGWSLVFVLAWLSMATLLFVGVLLGTLWRNAGRERWIFDPESLRFQRWLGPTCVKQLHVSLRDVESVTVEERRVSSRSGYRIYRRLLLTQGGRRLRGWGNLHADDAVKVRAALEMAARDFGFHAG